MPNCTLNLNDIEVERREHFIFYADDDFVIYKKDGNIEKASCDGRVLSRVACPIDYHHYCVLNTSDLIMSTGHRRLFRFRSDNSLQFHDVDHKLIGNIITPLYDAQDNIFFGTRNGDRVQFVGYDFDNKHRKYQTASWNFKNISGCCLHDQSLYALIDNSVLVCVDIKTGELKWNRIETDPVDSHIVGFREGILYVTQDTLRYCVNGKNVIKKMSVVKPSKILHADASNVYILGNGNNIYCYNFNEQRVVWGVMNNKPFTKYMVTGAKTEQELQVLIFVSQDELVFVDIRNGGYLYTVPVFGARDLVISSNHLLIHKEDMTTDMIHGEK